MRVFLIALLAALGASWGVTQPLAKIAVSQGYGPFGLIFRQLLCCASLVGAATAVFAAQVSYLVTGFGVIWSMALLGERYSGWIWGAMAVMFIGLFLVQPRRAGPLVRAREVGQDAV